MERPKLEDELKLCDVKKVNLGKAFDKLHSQASELLVFTHQWRDLEDYLKSVQGQVEKRFMELESREVDLQNRCFGVDTIGELEVKADGLRREIEDKEKVLKMLVEECKVKERSKASQLEEMMESLRKTQSLRRELDEENERKTRDLSLIQNKSLECGKILETRSLELTKTQGELDMKVEQLRHVKVELTTEMEHLERIQTLNRELEEDIKRKKKDLERLDSQQKQLEVVEEQLDSQKKLLETWSLELVSKEKEFQEKAKSLNNEMDETCKKMKSKAKELEEIERMIHQQSKHYESTKLLIEELTEELASKEKRHNDITEAIHKLSCKQLSKEERYNAENESTKKELKSLKAILNERDKQVEEGEKQIQNLTNSSKELSRQIRVRQEQFSSRQESRDKVKISINDLNAQQDSIRKKLRSVQDVFTQCCQNLCIKEKELKSLESILTEKNKQVEEGEKKLQDFSNSNEELIRQVKVRQEQVCSIEKAIRECTDELEAMRRHQSSITDLTVEMNSKESHLSVVKKKLQESMEELQSLEEKKVKMQASLMEHEMRAKELDEKEQKLKTTEQELAKWVKDYEVKAKQLSRFCQERNIDQHAALTPTLNSRKRGRHDEESLSQSLDIEKENTYDFENQRSPDKFKIDQIWAIYSDNDKRMPRKYAQIKRIDTSPELKLHVAPLVLYPPPINLMTHPVSCGRFKLKIGKAEVLTPSSFSHEVKAMKTSVNRFEVYPRKGEIWAMYKNWNITLDGSEEEDLEIVEVVETKEESIQAMLLTAKVFNKLLYGRCLESKAGFVDIPKKEVNRLSHQIPAVRHERSEWWEVDSKALLDLNPKMYKSISKDEENLNINGNLRRESTQMNWKKKWYRS
ncbi:unnamed protein product [Eruca vesicaria subsp. sativa]|uniref:DUF3444 domain-containing protein n=1 Tax=Eruca vesicaria subsp. sativa TaxID=29727 RepID=A0ABC8KND4_ERUVS|nr:unnamed protein product [Eruca vesicaria subsp. sativa]